MKKFKEFLKEGYQEHQKVEDLIYPYLDDLDNLSKIIKKDLIDNGFIENHSNPRFDILSLGNDSILEGDEIKYIPFNIRIQTIGIGMKLEIDIVEYFNIIKNVMNKYFYHKMVPTTSTDYYNILIDWQKLKNSNLFKSLKGVNKFNT